MTLRRLLALVAAALSLAATAAPPRPTPRRIASLSLAADEILVDLVPTDRLVAVTSFVDDNALSNVTGRVPASVARITHARLEQLVALEPDLVIVSDYSDADFLHLLDASGIRYFRLGGLESMDGIRKNVQSLADVVGEPEKGRAIVRRFDDSLAALSRRLEKTPRPRVLFWNDPDVYGKGSLADAEIECAGGRNAAAEMGVSGVRPAGAERVLAADPDFIVVPEGDPHGKVAGHPVLSHTRAVRDGHVIELPGPLLATISHYAARTCAFLAHALHPGQVPAAQP